VKTKSKIKPAEEWAKEYGIFPDDFISSSGYLAAIEVIRLAQKQAVEVGFNKSLMLDKAWSLPQIMIKLIEASDILLKDKDYDGMGWEQISIASEHAKKFITNIKHSEELKV